MTLKYGPGHWKWYKQIKLNKEEHQTKFDIYQIYGVWINPTAEVFGKPRHFTEERDVNYLSWIHRSHTNHIVHNLFNVYSNHKMLILQRTIIQNAKFAIYILDTPVTLNQLRSSSLQWQCRPQARLWPCKVWKILLSWCLKKKAMT